MSTMISAVPRRGRSFRGPEAFHDAVVGHTLLGEEAPREMDVFRRHAQAPVVARAHVRGHLVEIAHRADVDPGLRRRDHDIRVAEAERRQHLHPLRRIGQGLAHEVLARHAEMSGSGGQLRDDLGRGEEQDLDVLHACEGGAILPRSARLGESETRAREERRRVLLQAALGGHGDDERRVAHAGSPAPTRSIQTEQPTAGTGDSAPRC
jgi:hypothetical protein